MSDLVTWLRAQLDTDEANALAACQGDGYREWDNPSTGVVQVAGGDLEGLVLAPRNAALHIAVHDPARVLRQVAAMRKIVDWCSQRDRIYVGTHLSDHDAPRPEDFVEGRLKHPQDAVVLRHLAAVYADRDGYNPEWAPE